ncbi:MAG: hypothetical protein R3321_03350, partial [Nitrososphaeraceae archaeon]|nr:hypothetical protein [Nitrososphaeraceae archaeon]
MKDLKLHELASEGYNIARFLSIGPMGLRYNYTGINIDNDKPLINILTEFLEIVPSVNIRRFTPEVDKGLPFNYGLTNPTIIVTLILEALEDGYYVIVNETIDTHDGGVSGVIIDEFCEFAPNDTPRCVEKPGVCRTSTKFAAYLFELIYAEEDLIDYARGMGRVEFSIHPNPVGYNKENYLIWECDKSVTDNYTMDGITNWPNKFSEFLGDKAYGLIVADYINTFLVPTFTILHKKLGSISGFRSYPDFWVRTC